MVLFPLLFKVILDEKESLEDSLSSYDMVCEAAPPYGKKQEMSKHNIKDVLFKHLLTDDVLLDMTGYVMKQRLGEDCPDFSDASVIRIPTEFAYPEYGKYGEIVRAHQRITDLAAMVSFPGSTPMRFLFEGQSTVDFDEVLRTETYRLDDIKAQRGGRTLTAKDKDGKMLVLEPQVIAVNLSTEEWTAPMTSAELCKRKGDEWACRERTNASYFVFSWEDIDVPGPFGDFLRALNGWVRLEDPEAFDVELDEEWVPLFAAVVGIKESEVKIKNGRTHMIEKGIIPPYFQRLIATQSEQLANEKAEAKAVELAKAKAVELAEAKAVELAKVKAVELAKAMVAEQARAMAAEQAKSWTKAAVAEILLCYGIRLDGDLEAQKILSDKLQSVFDGSGADGQ